MIHEDGTPYTPEEEATLDRGIGRLYDERDAARTEVVALKSLCLEAADMMDSVPWQRGGLALVARLRKAGGT